MEYLETVLSYLSRGIDKVDEEDMRRAEGAFPFTGGEIMPTIAEKWIEQGMTKGIQQGTLQMGSQSSQKVPIPHYGIPLIFR